MDLCHGMPEEARRKKVYRELHRMVMGEPRDFPSDSFDAVVSVGPLTVGHAPASSLDELVRITRPGGHIVFTLRPDVYQTGGFKEPGAGGQVGAGGGKRALPAPAQGRAGGVPPGLGLPGQPTGLGVT